MGLLKSFNRTKLDLENPEPSGFNRLDTSTTFNQNNSGTPTNKANPGAPKHFFQKFAPRETYLQYVKEIPSKSNLLNLTSLDANSELATKHTIFDATNLDIEKAGVSGGIPYKQENDPTVYPITTQKRSSTTGAFPIQGQAATKYNQIFHPKKTYLNFIKNYI